MEWDGKAPAFDEEGLDCGLPEIAIRFQGMNGWGFIDYDCAKACLMTYPKVKAI